MIWIMIAYILLGILISVACRVFGKEPLAPIMFIFLIAFWPVCLFLGIIAVLCEIEI